MPARAPAICGSTAAAASCAVARRCACRPARIRSPAGETAKSRAGAWWSPRARARTSASAADSAGQEVGLHGADVLHVDRSAELEAKVAREAPPHFGRYLDAPGNAVRLHAARDVDGGAPHVVGKLGGAD